MCFCPCHNSSTSQSKWTNIMYKRLRPLIRWPAREELSTMPVAFRKRFKRCVVIIDCFKVFCERPTNLKARGQTSSNYKHHNTVKFLIGISSQGVVTFVSILHITIIIQLAGNDASSTAALRRRSDDYASMTEP